MSIGKSKRRSEVDALIDSFHFDEVEASCKRKAPITRAILEIPSFMTTTNIGQASIGDDIIGFDSADDRMDFCKGMSMTMSMSGFQSALFSDSPADCITFLFSEWELNRSGKFVLAMSKSPVERWMRLSPQMESSHVF